MEESKTAVVAALLGNAALALLKGVAASATGSAAMLAETFHSIADTGNQVLLLIGMRAARRPADDTHPFGHGKNVYFWSFVVSMLLFTIGGAVSLWEAVRHWLHPAARTPALWAYGVLAGSFVFESISLGVALHGLRRAAGPHSLREYWRENRDPTLVTVLLEDSAALISLVIAATGIWMTERTGNGAWDAAASGCIGLLLLTVACVLAAESHSLLVGERAPAWVERAIRAEVTADPAVLGLVELYTMSLGPRAVLAVLGVTFARDLSAPEVAAAVERLQQRVIERLDGLTDRRLVVIEPTPAPAGRRTPSLAAPTSALARRSAESSSRRHLR
jgi:cation diffusion facilitator family transporter